MPVLAAGWACAAAGLGAGLKKTPTEKLAQTALVSATLFLCSLVRVPLGPSSIHLTLLGAAGTLLGWSVFPALFTALLLQALLLQFGGILVLGVNTTIMGGAALLAYFLRLLLLKIRKFPPSAADFCAAFFAVIAGSALVTLALYTSGEALRATAALLFAANLPLAAVEGVITALCMALLRRALPGYAA